MLAFIYVPALQSFSTRRYYLLLLPAGHFPEERVIEHKGKSKKIKSHYTMLIYLSIEIWEERQIVNKTGFYVLVTKELTYLFISPIFPSDIVIPYCFEIYLATTSVLLMI